MPINEALVSITDVIAFKACRQRWDFGSPLRGNYRLPVLSKHLKLGSGVHEALSVYYAEPQETRTAELLTAAYMEWAEDEVALIDDEQMADPRTLELLDYLDLGNGMLKHYASWALAQDDFEVIESEVEFRLPLPFFPGKRVLFVGRADGWVKAHGEYYLLEHKTAKSFPRFDTLFLDEQCIAYQWGAQVDPKFEGRRPKGTIYTFLQKSLPKVPRQLKAGGLSKAMSIKTTAEVYEAELARLGLSTTLYGDILQALRDQENPFFRRVTIERTGPAIFKFGTNMVAIISEMIDPMVTIYPSPNWFVCPYCPFRDPCTMVQNGLSPYPILEADYIEAKPRYAKEEDE